MASYFWAEKFSSLGLLFNTKQGKQGLHRRTQVIPRPLTPCQKVLFCTGGFLSTA